MQVPLEQSRNGAQQQTSAWLETLVIGALTVVGLSGISIILSPIMAITALGLTLAFLLVFMIR